MKKVLVIAMLMLLPVMAKADVMPLTIGAGSSGYGITATDQGSYFTNIWFGLRTKVVGPHTAIYATYQNVGRNGGKTGHGVKALLVSGSETLPWLELMFDIGAVGNLAINSDGTSTTAFTVGGGVAFTLTEHLAPFFYVSSYDSGDQFATSFQFGMAVIGLDKLLKKD